MLPQGFFSTLDKKDKEDVLAALHSIAIVACFSVILFVIFH